MDGKGLLGEVLIVVVIVLKDGVEGRNLVIVVVTVVIRGYGVVRGGRVDVWEVDARIDVIELLLWEELGEAAANDDVEVG